MPRLEPNPPVFVSVLVVNPKDLDKITLEQILARAQCKSAAVSTIAEARSWMTRRVCPALVICEQDLPDGNWQVLFQETEAMSRPPRFIVSSRLADDFLWSEVLNLGGDNVLAVPFDAREVTHVVRCAMDAWNERMDAEPVRKAFAASARGATARGSAGCG